MSATETAGISPVHLLSNARLATDTARALLDLATLSVRRLVSIDGKLSAALLEQEQRAAHGLAWLATYCEAIRELSAYGHRLEAEGRLGETECLLISIGTGEYLAQIFGGIPMSQGEMVRLGDLGLDKAAIASALTPAVEAVLDSGNSPQHRARLVALIRQQQGAATVGDPGLDETLESIRSEMRKFAAAEVEPFAHQWHLDNAYIPMEVVEGLAGMGVFGLTMTYCGHPVASAVAREAIRIYEEENFPARVRRLETPFLGGLRELKSHALVGDVRGKGLLAGVELVWNKGTREPFPRERKIGAICAAIAEKNGLILRAIGDTLALCPPLVISEAEIGELLKRLRLALDETAATLTVK